MGNEELKIKNFCDKRGHSQVYLNYAERSKIISEGCN